MELLNCVSSFLGEDQGDHLLYTMMQTHQSKATIDLLNLVSGCEKSILISTEDVLLRAKWYSDDTHIIVVAEDDSKTYKKLGIYSLDSEKLQWLIDDDKRQIEYAFCPSNTSLICINELKQGRSICSLLNVATGVEQLIHMDNLQVVPTGFDSSSQKWIMLAYSAQQPTDLISATLNEKGNLENFCSITGFWSTVGFGVSYLFPSNPFEWTSKDGLRIHGRLYRNPELNKGTIIMIHGGPHEVALDRFHPWIQFLVGSGYCVLEPNFRGSIGFRPAFQELIYRDGWGGLEQHDISYGIKALLEHDISRKGRIAVMGASFGGYAALCQSSFIAPELIDATIIINGIGDLTLDFYASHPYIRQQLVEVMGGSPEEIPSKYRERSPINYTSNIRGDVMIVEGSLDANVNSMQHEILITSLKEQGKRMKRITFTNEGHFIEKEDNVLRLLSEVNSFLSLAFYRSYNEL